MRGFFTRSVPSLMIWLFLAAMCFFMLFHYNELSTSHVTTTDLTEMPRKFDHLHHRTPVTGENGQDKIIDKVSPISVHQQEQKDEGIPNAMDKDRTNNTTNTMDKDRTNNMTNTMDKDQTNNATKMMDTDQENNTTNTMYKEVQNNMTKTMLALFSTWINKPGKDHVRKSILGTWRRWHPSIVPLLLTNDPKMKEEAEGYGWDVRDVGETGCDNSSIPTLRGMFMDVISEFKDRASLFGFSNGDLVYDDSLEQTMKSFLKSEAQVIETRPVMVLGKRINVRVKDTLAVTNVTEVKSLAAKGRYPAEGSSDFFITNHLFPWDRVPEIVIGRLGFGMWVVAFARANNVTLYDVTKTVTVIHMTTHEGIFESSKSPNTWCNHKLINSRNLKPRSYDCGYIDCAGKRSVYLDDGSIVFRDVSPDTMMKGCHSCDL